ncbi:ABC transporter permease subunit [Bacillus sp. DJP31]|uniref:ABC transporter permease subunit n=1 Tax=Bacillus sp. DJP31 TaxID=3409789 RepID=UPI003BB621AB
MSLLLLTVLISTVTAVVLTISITLLPDKWRNRSKFIFFITESIPDIFFVVVVQALVIWFYKKTDVLLFSVVSGYEEQALTIPLITLCILPTFFIARILTLRFNEERIEEYVQFAVSKGLRKSEVIIKHILPNTLVNLFSQSKFIVWFVLSNLVMVEYIFNIHGITAFIIRFSSPEVFTLCVILIFVPLYIIILIFQKLLHFWVGDQI